MFKRKKMFIDERKGMRGNNSQLREVKAIIVSDFLPYHIQRIDL